MVVGAGHGHDLADAEVADGRLRRVPPLCRESDRSHGDDGSLPGHEPGHRRDRADATGVGERQGRALQLLHRERARACALDQPLVLLAEVAELALRGVTDHGHNEKTGAVLAHAVDGQTQVCRSGHACGLPVLGAGEMRGHLRARTGGAGDRVADEVREGHLGGPATCGERIVQLTPALVEDVDPDGAERGGRRDVAAALHVVDERGGGPTDRLRRLTVGDADGPVPARCGHRAGGEDVALGDDAAGP